MSGEQSSLCLCVSLELLMTRQAVTAANRKPQENSTSLIKQNASFWYFWSPQTGRVSQSWAVLRTADSTKLAQQKAHSGSGVDNLLSVFQITLTLSNALPTPWRSKCYSRLSAWQPGHLQPCNWWNQTVKCRFLYRCCRHWSMGGHGGWRSQSLKLCLQHHRKKRKGTTGNMHVERIFLSYVQQWPAPGFLEKVSGLGGLKCGVSISLLFILWHGYTCQLSSSVNGQPKTGPGEG